MWWNKLTSDKYTNLAGVITLECFYSANEQSIHGLHDCLCRDISWWCCGCICKRKHVHRAENDQKLVISFLIWDIFPTINTIIYCTGQMYHGSQLPVKPRHLRCDSNHTMTTPLSPISLVSIRLRTNLIQHHPLLQIVPYREVSPTSPSRSHCMPWLKFMLWTPEWNSGQPGA